MKFELIIQTRRAAKMMTVWLLTAALSVLSIQPAAASQIGARRNAAALFDALRRNGWNVRDSFSTGFLQRGQSMIIRTTLNSGNTYKIAAAGCEDAFDVDVAVFDENENLISSDTDNAPLAVADITPKWSGTFFIVVKMYNSTPAGAHFVVQYAYQ